MFCGSANQPRVPQLLKPVCPGAPAPRRDKPAPQESQAPQLESSPCSPQEKSPRSNEGPARPKTNKQYLK